MAKQEQALEVEKQSLLSELKALSDESFFVPDPNDDNITDEYHTDQLKEHCFKFVEFGREYETSRLDLSIATAAVTRRLEKYEKDGKPENIIKEWRERLEKLGRINNIIDRLEELSK